MTINEKLNALWIDDIRKPPPNYLWAKTSSEAIFMILENKIPFEHIAFDHDLGETDDTQVVAKWLRENKAYYPSIVTVHSDNGPGKEWLFREFKDSLVKQVMKAKYNYKTGEWV